MRSAVFGYKNQFDSKNACPHATLMRPKLPSLPLLPNAVTFGRPPTAAEYVADHLRASIVDGRLAPGTGLGQEEIASRLGVSRMPVREALQLLESEGWVEIAPRRGAIVAVLDARDIREVFALRATVEQEALRRSLPLLTNDDFNQAAATLDAMDDEQDLSVYNKLHKSFHLTLTGKAGRRHRALISDMLDVADRYFRIEMKTLANHKESQAEHRAILASCRAGDVEAAVFALIPHIADAGEELAQHLEARYPKE
jgi:DNA-binding GntR family transcriptional regulator